MLNRSRLSVYMTHVLIDIESLIGDIHINLDTYGLFTILMPVLRISNFQNNDYYESWTLFKKGELIDLISRLEFEEYI